MNSIHQPFVRPAVQPSLVSFRLVVVVSPGNADKAGASDSHANGTVFIREGNSRECNSTTPALYELLEADAALA